MTSSRTAPGPGRSGFFVGMTRFLALLAPAISMSIPLLGVATVHAHSQTHDAPRQEARALGGEFELVDTDGRAFKLSSLRGKIVLIYFGYTGCPDACPTDLLLFRDLLERLGSRKESAQPIFISVDPARDTLEHLAAYASAFSPTIRALTGSEKQLRQVAKAYGSYFNYVGRTPGSTTYTVDHSVSIYVVNGEGKLVSVIPFGTPLEEVVRRVERMLDKAAGGNKPSPDPGKNTARSVR